MELCRLFQRQGRVDLARETAREGLLRFPNSQELREILHATWRRSAGPRLQELKEKLKRDGTSYVFLELIQYYRDYDELDEACRVGERTVVRYPQDPACALAFGRVLVARFHRDHVAQDGALGLKHIHRAAEISPSDFEPHFSLAETYYYIGAISKALFHLYKALDAAPDHPEANRLYRVLTRLPLERQEESELLREVEENDEAHFRYLPQDERDSTVAPGSPTMTHGIEQLSALTGVRRVALSHRARELMAQDGRTFEVDPENPDPFVELALGFRRNASLSAKRMGIGAFREAELSWAGGRILAFAAGRTILLIEAEPNVRLASVMSDARNFLAGCTPAEREEVNA